MSAILLLGLVLALLVLRQPLTVILIAAIAYVHLVWGHGYLDYIVEDMWTSLNKELILSVPLFLLCGAVMTEGTAARRLVRIVRALTAPTRGGLGVAAIISCAVFAAISGSSIVTMIAVGSVLYPAMKEAGYTNRFALGTVVSGGTLGIIIPPSIPLILYGLVTETSIVDLFLAGIIPGLVLVALMTAYAIWANRNQPAQKMDWRELRLALREGVWAALFPVILLGGIYSGYYSPTESAAVALVYALVIEFFIHREMTMQKYFNVVTETAKLGGALFPLIAVALSLNLVLTEYRVPAQMVELVSAWIDSPIAFLVVINLLLLAVGAFMTTNEAILILGPILMPVAQAYGFHPVHFGIIMIVNLEIGYLTPPVGMNLMVALVTFKQSFNELVKSVLPYIAIMVLGLILISVIPWLSLGLL
ncbi:C4-dicarboxylate transporter, DctM subunit [Thalassovita litoralis]|jgi:C4-dicarboxylate transporter DctM subunit|uniref:TRAP transporter large permease protein n=1 Tax=Thalassovita litoralis TaxID=1010611 RepID=A0A521BNU5_9RHOB|nr:TRAP transporter large permease [Thalassovita litoralis]SMO48802.1 C4-dicarboxylate transporter, DctM subunit [Thalassovita litoralis]